MTSIFPSEQAKQLSSGTAINTESKPFFFIFSAAFAIISEFVFVSEEDERPSLSVLTKIAESFAGREVTNWTLLPSSPVNSVVPGFLPPRDDRILSVPTMPALTAMLTSSRTATDITITAFLFPFVISFALRQKSFRQKGCDIPNL